MIGGSRELAAPIPGGPPDPGELPQGCRFRPRCPYAADICRIDRPPLYDAGPSHGSACHFWDTLPVPQGILPSEGRPDPRLERLFGAFVEERAGL